MTFRPISSGRWPGFACALWLLMLIAFQNAPASTSAQPSAPWPHEQSDVAPDPAIRWGRLENGLRYAIRPNAEPRGRVALVMQVAVGSAHERDDQLGYAHFVEHMMFRGTRRFPANTLIGKLQREGLAMGADSSAFTNHLSTFYNLDLPQNSAEKISLGLSILRDFADGATLAKKDLKLEARVIESERRTRDSSAAQIGEALTQFLQPDALFSRRPPIGTTASIEAATAEKLREFHEQWYRPSRLTIIAVGDADPDLLEKLIREHFSALKAPARPEPPAPDLAFPAPRADFQARFFPTPMEGGTSVMLHSVSSFQAEPDSLARRRQLIVRNAGVTMLHARLGELTRKAPADYGDSQVAWVSHPSAGQFAYVRVDARRDLWRRALRLGEQELRRALQHGFTSDELAVQTQAYRNWYQESIRSAANRESATLAEYIRTNLEGGFVTTSPEQDWALAEPLLATLTADECAASFRALWATDNRRLAVIGKHAPAIADRDIVTAYEESRAVTFFGAQDERKVAQFDYTDFGPPGKILSRDHVAAIDAHAIVFANDVRLNVKTTDYEKNVVHVRLRLGLGMASEPADKLGLGLLTGGAFIAGGLGRYDNTELGRMLAGDSMQLAFTVEEDAFYFTGHCEPAKFEKLLQLITAFFTDAAYRPEGFAAAYSQLQAYYSHAMREPSYFLGAAAPRVIASGDPRYGLPHFDLVAARTLPEMQAWLKPVLASGPIEIGIAGAIEVDPAIAAVSRTLGTLAMRSATLLPDRSRRPTFPARATGENWRLDTPEAKAAVRAYWPGVGLDDFRVSRQLQVLADILNDRLRLKIREELGATYGPQADEWGSELWPGYGTLSVAIETSPALVEKVAALTRKIAADLAAHGITPEEFTRAIEPHRAGLDQQMRNNTYWTYHVLAKMQQMPERIDWPRTRKEDYLTMTRESVEKLARRHLAPERACIFIAKPAR